MTTEARNPAHLGGISTMLTQSGVCPTCGRLHETGLMKFVGGARADRTFRAALEERGAAGYAPLGESLIASSRRRVRSMSIPWPMPPMVEEYP